jgi:hypothetical protein
MRMPAIPLKKSSLYAWLRSFSWVKGPLAGKETYLPARLIEECYALRVAIFYRIPQSDWSCMIA